LVGRQDERGAYCLHNYGPADASALPKPHNLLPHLVVVVVVVVVAAVAAVVVISFNPPVLKWRCRLTQVDVYSGRKTVVVDDLS